MNSRYVQEKIKVKRARFSGWYEIFFPKQKIYNNKQTKQNRRSPLIH